MKKYFCFIFVMLLAFVSIFGATFFNGYAKEENQINVLGFGDSISAGYSLSTYGDYVNGVTQVATGCFTDLFSTSYKEPSNTVVVQNNAVSGDDSTDLLDLLTNSQNPKYQEVQTRLADADIITVCIGANNVLGPAMSYLGDYLMGLITDSDYRVILSASVTKFNTEYKQIIDILDEQKNKEIFVMTSYNPYKWSELTEIQLDVSSFIASFIDMETFDASFQACLSTTMEYLHQINQTIIASESNHVNVVDIWQVFNEIATEAEYRQYLNTDFTKVVITDNEVMGLINGDFNSLIGQLGFDPHPTMSGQSFINENFLTKKQQALSKPRVVLNFDKNLSGDIFDLKTATISLQETNIVYNDNIRYDLVSKIGESEQTIKSDVYSTTQIDLNFSGEGKLFIKGYNSSSPVYVEGDELFVTSDPINFALTDEYSVTLSANKVIEGKDFFEIEDFYLNCQCNLPSTSSSQKISIEYFYCEDSTENLIMKSDCNLGLFAEDFFGSGYFVAKMFYNNEYVKSSNHLAYNILWPENYIKLRETVFNSAVENQVYCNISFIYESEKQLTIKLFNKVGETETLVGTVEDDSIRIATKDFVGEGIFFFVGYDENGEFCRSKNVTYKFYYKYNVTISATQDLSNVDVSVNSEITITSVFVYPQGENISFKLYNKVGTQEHEISLVTEVKNLNTLDLVGTGEFFVKMFKNGSLLKESNHLPYNIVWPKEYIKIQTNAEDLDCDIEENPIKNITFLYKNEAELVFKLFNVVGEQKTFVSETTERSFQISTADFEGSGHFLIEGYEDEETLITYASVEYSFSYSYYLSFSTIYDTNWDLTTGSTLFVSLRTNLYNMTVNLYSKINGTESFVKYICSFIDEGSYLASFDIDLENFNGKSGTFFLKAIRNNEVIKESNEIAFSVFWPENKIMASIDIDSACKDEQNYATNINTTINVQCKYLAELDLDFNVYKTIDNKKVLVGRMTDTITKFKFYDIAGKSAKLSIEGYLDGVKKAESELITLDIKNRYKAEISLSEEMPEEIDVALQDRMDFKFLKSVTPGGKEWTKTVLLANDGIQEITVCDLELGFNMVNLEKIFTKRNFEFIAKGFSGDEVICVSNSIPCKLKWSSEIIKVKNLTTPTKENLTINFDCVYLDSDDLNFKLYSVKDDQEVFEKNITLTNGKYALDISTYTQDKTFKIVGFKNNEKIAQSETFDFVYDKTLFAGEENDRGNDKTNDGEDEISLPLLIIIGSVVGLGLFITIISVYKFIRVRRRIY